jgi:hypothetical protein
MDDFGILLLLLLLSLTELSVGDVVFLVVGDAGRFTVTGAGRTVLVLAGKDVRGGDVVVRIGNKVGNGTLVLGNDMTVDDGGDIVLGGIPVMGEVGTDIGMTTAAAGAGTGDGTVTGTGAATGTRMTPSPAVLSIQAPDASKPTQVPSNRLEQSKYGKKSISDMI